MEGNFDVYFLNFCVYVLCVYMYILYCNNFFIDIEYV